MTLDIVVVNYRTPDDLRAWGRSLMENLPQILFTVTVCNVSPEPEDIAASSAVNAQTGALELAYTENIGFGRACNLAAKARSGDLLLLTNADIEFTPQAVDKMARYMDCNPKVGVIGPRQVNQSNQLVHAGILGTNERPEHRGWKTQDRGQYQDIELAVTVSGSAYLTRRSIWEELDRCSLYEAAEPGHYGPFLETPLTYEETWFSYHAAAHGWPVYYLGSTTLIHKWHNSVRQNNMDDYWAQSMKVAQEQFRKACAIHGIACD